MFPQSMPFPMRKTENQRKTLRIVKLLAPKDFSTPIMEVRYMMIISRPDTMVNPATPIIRMRMTQMLTSKMPSQAKI